MSFLFQNWLRSTFDLVTPSIITRNFKNDLMNDIFNSNEIISPISGQIGEPLKMALEFYEK
jgi:hypothetical protein